MAILNITEKLHPLNYLFTYLLLCVCVCVCAHAHALANAHAQHGSSQVHVPLYMCADPSTNFESQCFFSPRLRPRINFTSSDLAGNSFSPWWALLSCSTCHLPVMGSSQIKKRWNNWKDHLNQILKNFEIVRELLALWWISFMWNIPLRCRFDLIQFKHFLFSKQLI